MNIGIDLGPAIGRFLSEFDTFIESVVVSLVYLVPLTVVFFVSNRLSSHTLWYLGLAGIGLILPELALIFRTQWRSIRGFLMGIPRAEGSAEAGSSQQDLTLVVPPIFAGAVWLLAVLAVVVAWQVLIQKSTAGSTTTIYVQAPTEPPGTSQILGTQATPKPATIATLVPPTSTPIVRAVEAMRVVTNGCGANEVTTVEIDLTIPPDQQLKYWLLRSDDSYPTNLYPQGPPLRRRQEKPHLVFNVFTPVCERRYKVSLIECTEEGSAVIEALVENPESFSHTPPSGCTDIGQEFGFDGVK